MTETSQTIHAFRYEVGLEATDTDLAALGEAAMKERAAQDNLIVVGQIRVVLDAPSVFVVDGLRGEGWLPTDDPDVGTRYGPPEARTVVWAAEAQTNPEAVAVEGVREDGGAVMVTVPHLIEARGGSVRAVHWISGPVEVSAYRHNGEPIGYLVAVEINDDEVQVEVNPGTALLRVVAAT